MDSYTQRMFPVIERPRVRKKTRLIAKTVVQRKPCKAASVLGSGDASDAQVRTARDSFHLGLASSKVRV